MIHKTWVAGVQVEVVLKRRKDLYGKRGTLTGKKLGHENFNVKLDGIANPKTSDGTYWFERSQLRLVR